MIKSFETENQKVLLASNNYVIVMLLFLFYLQ